MIYTRPGRVVQWVKAPAIKPENLSVIPKTHKVEKEDLSSNLHMCAVTCSSNPCQINKCKKLKNTAYTSVYLLWFLHYLKLGLVSAVMQQDLAGVFLHTSLAVWVSVRAGSLGRKPRHCKDCGLCCQASSRKVLLSFHFYQQCWERQNRIRVHFHPRDCCLFWGFFLLFEVKACLSVGCFMLDCS